MLRFLHQRFGFGLWMITRIEGDDWIVLQAEDHGYGVVPGTVLRWTDSFCARMVAGDGPRIAPDSTLVEVYRDAPIGSQVPIRSYIGIPLNFADGTLFGTLCGIDPSPQPERLREEQQLLELLAGLLSGILDSEIKAAVQARRNERLEMEAQSDPLTQLANRRAWDQLLAKEEERCRRYGSPAAVMILDLDELKTINDSQGHGAGDALLVNTATALRNAIRDNDVAARLGGDEFGVIAVDCDRAGADLLLARTRQILAQQGITASVGIAVRNPASGLSGAWEAADLLMYEDKRSNSEDPLG